MLPQVFLVVWNQSGCVSLSSGLSDQELATDYELSNNENERTDSDSSIDNNLDHLCTAKSTEFKMKNNIPEFEYTIKMGHHGWTPVRVQKNRCKGNRVFS